MNEIKLERVKVEYVKQDAKSLKQLKQLIRHATGEQLVIREGDWIILCRVNTKIIGMCCITHTSPERHFHNENEDTLVPYIYNYVCDYKHRSKKPSVILMKYLVEFYDQIYGDLLNTMENIGMHQSDTKQLNLDVRSDNQHAQQFFQRNGFEKKTEYQNGSSQYYSYTKLI